MYVAINLTNNANTGHYENGVLVILVGGSGRIFGCMVLGGCICNM